MRRLTVNAFAVQFSSTETNEAYAIVESVAAPACSPPMHLHRNEEEHFVVLAGTYRILAKIGCSTLEGTLSFPLYRLKCSVHKSFSCNFWGIKLSTRCLYCELCRCLRSRDR